MSAHLKCLLCCGICNKESENLYNSAGESNGVYELVVKYFDPLLLLSIMNMRKENGMKVLCKMCWNHITDFHEFQQTVVRAQTELVMKQQQIKDENKLQEQSKAINKSSANENNSQAAKDDDFFTIKSENVDVPSDKVIIYKNKPQRTTRKTSNNNESTYLNLEQDEIKSEIKNETCVVAKIVTDDDEDDEEPLIHLIKKKNTIRKCEARRGRKRVKPTSIYNDDVKMSKKSKSKDGIKTVRDPSTKAYNSLEKMRELDAFLAQHRPELECDICNATVANFDYLRSHFNQEHNTRCYVKCCSRLFYRRCKFVDHLRLHINPNLYKCDMCDRASSSKYNLSLHKQVMHSGIKEQHECEICHRTFNQKPSLTRHMGIHAIGNKDFVCKECGKAYVLEVQLQTHIKTVHTVNLICDQCGKTLHSAGNLRQHLREHAGIKRPKWSCDQCGAELMTRSSLNHHKLAFHHDGSIAFVCKECGKVTASERALLLHKKNVHEAIRKFKCTYCDKAFKKNKTLQEHIATHTGQDLYQCPHCPRTFKVSANMHHHRKKAHPIEWAKARQNRLQLPKVNLNKVTKEVVM